MSDYIVIVAILEVFIVSLYAVYMADLEILARLFLSIGFGAMLGLETETRASENAKKQPEEIVQAYANFKLGGVRTYILLSLFGALGGLLFYFGQSTFGYLIFGAVMGIILAAYVLNVYYRRAFGMTAEIAIMIVTIIGFMSTSGLISLQILTVIVVILTFVLSQKQGIAYLVSKIAHEELTDVVKFTIVALVVLPFLPNNEIYLRDLGFMQQLIASGEVAENFGNIALLNPFRLWQYVVLISGFSLLGYFASRTLGKARGLLLTGLLGGLVSSTSVIVSMAARSKQEPNDDSTNSLAGSALISHAVSFLQVTVITLSVSVLFFRETLPLSIAMSLVPLGIGLLLILSSRGRKDSNINLVYKPFSLNFALKFALLLTVVKLVVQVSNIYLPESAFVLVTAFSGFAGIDVAAIAVGELVSKSAIPVNIGIITYAAVNIVNFTAKSMYAYWQGTQKYTQVIVLGMLGSLIAVGVVLLMKLT